MYIPDAVENVDEHYEECDEEGHPPGHDLRLDGERHPRDDDEHEAGQVHLDHVLHPLAHQLDLEAARRVSPWKKNKRENGNRIIIIINRDESHNRNGTSATNVD